MPPKRAPGYDANSAGVQKKKPTAQFVSLADALEAEAKREQAEADPELEAISKPREWSSFFASLRGRN